MSDNPLDVAMGLCQAMKLQRNDCFALVKDLKRVSDFLVDIKNVRSRNPVSPDPETLKVEKDKLLKDLIQFLRRYNGHRILFSCNTRRQLMQELGQLKEANDKLRAKLGELLPQFSLSLKVTRVVESKPDEEKARARVIVILSEAKSMHLLVPNEEVDFGKGSWHGGKGAFRGNDAFVRRLEASRIEELQATLEEIKAMSRLSHRNIERLVGITWGGDVTMLTECVHGENLWAVIAKYQADERPIGFDKEKFGIALQIAEALAYAHALDPPVIHQQLLPTDIFVTESGEVKVTGFGCYREPPMCSAIIFPALLPSTLASDKNDVASDMVFFGILLSMLDMHEYPFKQAHTDTRGMFQIVLSIAQGSASLPFSASTPPAISHLGQMCIATTPELRPTAQVAVNVLKNELNEFD